jgi:hypothetical protein
MSCLRFFGIISYWAIIEKYRKHGPCYSDVCPSS